MASVIFLLMAWSTSLAIGSEIGCSSSFDRIFPHQETTHSSPQH